MTHIRYVDISELTQQDRQRLYAAACPERKSRADRYLRQGDSDRCIVADALLRYALGGVVGLLEKTPQGKPFLKDRPDLHFNLTHSGPWVAIAWGSEPVGLDVEVFRDKAQPEELAQRFFCADELAWLRAATEGERTQRFFKLWTMKESYLKYRGTGLTQALNSFSVLEPEKLGICFVSDDLEGASMTLCAHSPEVDTQPLTVSQI